MLKARKKNRVVRIPDEKAEEYKRLGYTITDMEGGIIYAPVDKDTKIAELEEANKELKEKLAAFEQEATAESKKKNTSKAAKAE